MSLSTRLGFNRFNCFLCDYDLCVQCVKREASSTNLNPFATPPAPPGASAAPANAWAGAAGAAGAAPPPYPHTVLNITAKSSLETSAPSAPPPENPFYRADNPPPPPTYEAETKIP